MGKKLSREQFEHLVTQDGNNNPVQLDKAQQKKMAAEEFQSLLSQAPPGSPNPGMESKPDTQYYKGYLQVANDWERHLGFNQPWYDEAGNAGTRILLNTIPGLIGNAAAALDFEDYFNKDQEVGNDITRAMESIKEKVNKDLAPIYRQNNGDRRKPLDLGDSAWWFENGAMIAESAAEFALLGYGLGAAMSKASQAAKWVGNLKSAEAGIVAGKTAEGLGVFANAAMLNQAESILSATQVYDQTIKSGGTPEQAAAAAAHVVNTNRANILLNLSSAAALMKGVRHTRELVKAKGVLKPIFFEGAQEYMEETINLYSETLGKSYGEHLIQGGTEDNFQGRTAGNFADTMFSMEGLEAGILGFAGGAIQTGATTGLMSDHRKQIKERAAQQQAEIKKLDTLRKENKLSNIYDLGESLKQHTGLIQQRNVIMQKLDQPGPVDPRDLAALKRIDRDLLALQALDQFNLGTTEMLEKQYQDIAMLPQEEAQKQGFTGEQLNEKSPVYYKTRAQEIIKTLKAYEDIYNKYTLGYVNQKELFGIKAQEYDLKEDRKVLVKQIEEQKSIAQEALNAIERPGLLWGFGSGMIVDDMEKQGYAGEVGNVNDPRLLELRKEMLKQGKETEAYKRYKELEKVLEKHDKALRDISKLYAERSSSKHQDKLRNDVKTAQELIKEAQKQLAADQKKAEQAQAKADKAQAQQAQAQQQTKPVETATPPPPGQPAPVINTLDALKSAVAKLNDPNKPALTKEEDAAIKDPNFRELFEDMMAKAKEEARQAEAASVAGQSGDPVTSNTGDPTNYTSITDKQITNLIKVIQTESEYEWEQVNREKRLTHANNVLAYLARNFERVLYASPDGNVLQPGFAEVSDDLNPELQDPNILDPKYLNVGDEIKLQTEHNYEGFVNYQGKRVLWKELVKQLTGQEFSDYVPISVRKNNIVIGYMHSPEWITQDRIQGDVELDRKALSEIRSHVIMHGDTVTKISKRLNGKLIASKDKQSLPVWDAFVGEGPAIKVMYNGNLVNSRSYTPDPSVMVVNQSQLTEGFTYILLPVNYSRETKQTHVVAVPARHNKLSADHVHSLSSVARIYMKVVTGQPLADDEKTTVAKIKESSAGKVNGVPLNLDITTYEGARNYFRMFVYSHNKDTTADLTLKAYLSTRGSAVTALEVTPNGIDFGHGGGLEVHVGQFDFTKNAGEYLKKLEEHLAETYYHVDLDYLNNSLNVPVVKPNNEITTADYNEQLRVSALSTIFRSVNINHGKPDAEVNPAYSIQAVIEFDGSFPNQEAKKNPVGTFDHAVRDQNALTLSQAKIHGELIYNQIKLLMGELSAGVAVGSVMGDMRVLVNRLQDILKEHPDALDADKKGKWPGVVQYVNQWDKIPSNPTERSNIKFPEVPPQPVDQPISIKADDVQSIQKATREIQGQIGDVDIKLNTQTDDYLDNTVEFEDNLPGAFLPEDKYKQLVFKFKIPGLSFKAQNSVVKFLAADINRKFVAGKYDEKKVTIPELLKVYKTGINKIYVDSVNNNSPHKGFELILKHWDIIENMTGYLLQSLYNFTINKDQLGEILSEEDASVLIYGQNALEKDPRDTLSARFKRFLSDVEDPMDKNFLGRGEIMHYAEVYNHMLGILAGNPPVFDKMMEVLNTHTSTFPWLNQVIDKLIKADSQIKNEFVVSFAKHYVNTKFALFNINPKTGEADARILDDNSSSRIQVIKQAWKNNLLGSNLVSKDFTTGEYKFNTPLVAGLISQFESVNKDNARDFNISRWLFQMGIEIHPQLVKQLKDQGYKVHPRAASAMDYYNLFTNDKGVFKLLYKILKNIHANPDGDVRDSKLLTDNVITRLASMNEQFDTQTLTQSHRSGNSIIFSYTDNKFVVNRVQELKSNIDLLNKLSALPFSKNSYWLQQMLEYDYATQTYTRDASGNVILKSNAVVENFDFAYLGLQVLKEKGALAPNKYTLEQLTAGEHEKAKLAFYFNKGVTSQGVNLHQFFDLTLSNKGTMVSLTAPGVPVKLDEVAGTVSKETVDLLFDHTVMPEIMRMLNYKANHNINGYAKGANLFYFYPRLNQITELFNEDGTLIKDILQKPELVEKIKTEVKAYIKQEVEYKIDLWKDSGIVSYDEKGDLQLNYLDGAYLKRLSGTTADKSKANLMKLAATDMAVNYMLANVNIFQLVSTDPANYFKSSSQDKFQQVLDTFDNVGKRLGGEISPGKDVALDNLENETYTVGVVNDAALDSLGLSGIEELFKNEPELVKAYKNIKATDAQEFTTVAEHIKILYKSGKLTDAQWQDLSSKIPGNKFEKTDLDLILQPMKPIQVGSKMDLTNNVERRFYIKSSSIPLIPQLIKGHELEKVLDLMNKQKIDRLVFQSAFKVGSVEKPANLFDSKGRVIDGVTIPVLELQRKYFRVQQEVPVKTSGEILRVSQASKLAFVNKLHDEKYQKLEKKYLTAYDNLYKLSLQDLANELGFDLNANQWDINPAKLKNLITKEISTRSYPIQDLEALDINPETGEFNMPIWALNYSDRLESFLLSIVKNRVNKQYMTGSSFILGTEVGFQTLDAKKEIAPGKSGKKGVSLEELQEQRPELASKIVYTTDFTGQLRPAGTATDHFHEVLVPWKFKDLRLEDYLDENRSLDTSKFDPELLKMFGMRIPNQGPNSTAALKIVGFLPEEAGDLLIAPRDLVTQMGSDFDIDKLYAYMYAYFVNDAGKVKKLKATDQELDGYLESKATRKLQGLLKHLMAQGFEEEAGREFLKEKEIGAFTYDEIVNQINKKLQHNTILDVHLEINTDPAADIQRSIKRPLDYGELADLAKEINETLPGHLKILSPVSSSYQQIKYTNAASSSSAIGAFAVANTFNALVQGKDIELVIKDENDKTVGMSTRFGSEVFDGNLSRAEAADGFKSDNVSVFLSAAVDDEVQQILNKINVNDVTIPIITFMLQAGFSQKTIVYFINQDIIRDYVKEFKKISEKASGFVANPGAAALNKVLGYKKYTITSQELDAFQESEKWEKYHDLGKTDLRELIHDREKTPDYVKKQIALLFKFDGLMNNQVKLVRHMQSAIATDGPNNFPKTIFESMIKQQDIESLAEQENVMNADLLIGDFVPVSAADADATMQAAGYIKGDYYWIKPNTIAGYAGVYGIIAANKIWNTPKYFPYSLPGVKNALSEVVSFRNVQGTSAASRGDKLLQGFRQLKNFMYANYQTVQEDRLKLLYDTKDNQSLATIYEKIWQSDAVQSNKFLKLLVVRNPSTNTEPKILTFRNPMNDVFGDFEIYTSIMDALTKPKDLGMFNGIQYDTRIFVEHLFRTGHISGKFSPALEVMKYAPVKWLQLIGMPDYFKNFDFGSLVNRSNNELSVNTFTRQYFQHNPRQAPLGTDADIANAKFNASLAPVYQDKKLVAYTVTDPFMNIPQTKFVAFKDSSAPGGYALFEKISVNGKYVRISTLGSAMHNEYDLTAQYATSLIQDNNTPNNPVMLLDAAKEQEATIEPDEVKQTAREQEELTMLNFINEHHDMFVKYGFDFTQSFKVFSAEEHDKLLDAIAASTNDNGFKQLAIFLKKKLKELPNYRLTQDNSIGTAGKAQISLDKTTDGNLAFPNQTVQINISRIFERNGSEIALQQTVLHEMVHAVTQFALRAPANDRQRRARARLNNLLEKYRKAQNIQNPEDLGRPGTVPGTGWTDPVTQEFVMLQYPAKNIDEFVVGLWTSEKLRQRLQELVYDEETNKTFWQELIEIFHILLRSFGIEPNTTVGKAMMDSLTLMEDFNIQRPEQKIGEEQPASNLEAKLIRGNIWDQKGIPVITTNMGGVHGAGLANQAYKKGLIEYNKDGAFDYRRPFDSSFGVITFPVKEKWSDKTSMDLLKHSADLLIAFALINPSDTFLLPLIGLGHGEGDVNQIAPVIAKILKQTTNVKLVVADANTDLGKQGTARTDSTQQNIPAILKAIEAAFNNVTTTLPVNMQPPIAQEPARQSPPPQPAPVTAVAEPGWTPKLKYEGGFRPKNQEQEDAIIAIRKFIESGDPKQWFTLEGKAGTGKTTLIQEAIKPYVNNKQVAVAALAHKAKRVLVEKLTDNDIDVKGYSMAALLGMELNLETGEFTPKKFKKTEADFAVPIEKLDLIIVDESSMINEQNLDLIMQLKKKNAKVIFLGDIGQLDPIRKENVDKPSGTFVSNNKSKLLTRVRQGEESPILPYADYYWNNSVTSGNPTKDPVDPFKRVNVLTPKGNLIFAKSMQEILPGAISAFKEGLAAGNPDRIRIVAFRNDTRTAYNRLVRSQLYQDQYAEGAIPEYVDGDILIMMDNFKLDEGLDKDRIIENATEFVVINAAAYDDTFRDAKGKDVTLKAFSIAVKWDGAVVNVPVISRAAKAQFDKIVSEFFAEAKKLPMGYERTRKMAEAWSVKGRYASLDYAYALTSHKSQGSTFETVIVDEDDIMSVGPTSNSNKSKSMYTAITRASKTAVVVSSKNPGQKGDTEKVVFESMMADPSGDEKSARFVKLIDERNAAINNFNKRLAELNLEMANATTAAERVQLLKRKNKVEEKLDRLYQELEDVKSAVQVEDLKIYAENDLDEITRLIVLGDNLSFDEIDILSQKIKLWVNAVDNLFTEAEKKSDILKAVFRIGKPGDKYPLGIENTAKDLQEQLDQIKIAKIVAMTQAVTGNKNLTEDVLFKAVTDISKLASTTLDLSKAPLAILQTIAEMTKETDSYTKAELFAVAQELEGLVQKAYAAAARQGKFLEDIYIEKDAQGNRTGNLVLPYAPEYLSTKYGLYHAAKEADKRGDSKLWKNYFEFLKDNEVDFDIRRLIEIPGYENHYQAEQADGKHKAELIATLGEAEFTRRLDRAKVLYNRYEILKDTQAILLSEDTGLTADQQKKALEEWEELNSPVKYLDKKFNKYKSVNYGYKYLESVPLKTSRSGKPTAWYSKQFEEINADPDLLALHQFMVKTLVDLRKYLPQDLQEEFRINTLPAMQKSVMEMFKSQGIAAGMVSMLDATKETMSSLDTGNIVYSDAQSQGRYLTPRVTSLNDKIKERFDEKIRDATRLNEPIDRQKLYADAASEISNENSFDIPRLLGAYASVVLSYKHKSRIEDAMRIAEEVFNTKMKEIKTNALGEPIFRNMAGNLTGVETTDGLVNYKEMLKYHLDKMFGVPQKIEGKLEGKVYTDREKKRKTKLEGALKDVDAKIEDLKTQIAAAEADTSLSTAAQATQLGDLKVKLTVQIAAKSGIEGDLALLGRAVTGTGIAELVHRYIYLKGLGWNMFSAFTNVGFGVISNLIEASGNQFYTQGQILKGYRLAMHSIGKNYTFNTVETSTAKKIRLLMDQWDVLKKSSEELFRNKTLVTGKAAFLNAYNMQNRSEYVNQAPVMIAVMMNTKLNTKAGQVSLWDIYGEEGEWDVDKHGDLETVFPRAERAKFKSRLDKVIRHNHGNYDPASPLKVKENILGRALSVFRTWMYEGFANRFEKGYTDEILGMERKGRYRSYGSGSLALGGAALGTVIFPGIGTGIGAGLGFLAGKALPNKERRLKEFENMSDFDELFFTTKQLLRKLAFKSTKFDERFTPTDAANLRRNMTEISLLLALTGVFMLLKHMLDGDDDDESRYSLNTLINLSNRLQQDIGFYADPISFMHIIKNPLPAAQLITDSAKLIKASAYAIGGEDEIPTGSYAGQSRLERAFTELVPLWTQAKTLKDIGTQEFIRR